jgi:hypothetical protein
MERVIIVEVEPWHVSMQQKKRKPTCACGFQEAAAWVS